MRDVETLIIGAGISGLGAAAFLGRGADLVVLERDSAIGGYCKTVKKDGFVWDYSGHFFHFKHPELEAWLRERMPGQDLRTVTKKTFISYAGKWVDFPFQKNIHQLPQEEFIDCLYDLYFARAPGIPRAPETNFKEMLYARFGRSIAEKFLIPYNEKLYATDVATLDKGAMGRFFPYAELTDVIRNMRQADNSSYNATFTYPAGGAIEYVNAVASEVAPASIHVEEPVEAIDLARRVARTPKGEYHYRRLVSTLPLPSLLALAGLEVDATWAWNQVLVFNLGFDRKGPEEVHWLYVPNPERGFYRVGFYDNILDQPRMSLYVEVGFPRSEVIDVGATRARVLEDLAKEGLVTGQRLVAEHSVVMDPAYVHITARSLAETTRLKRHLASQGVHTIGRYGGWTYCSIEDNLLEAKALATSV